MTQYERGRAFEYRAKKFFENLGYFVVRSAGSHSPADLVAIKKQYFPPSEYRSEVLLIQCKAEAKPSAKKELAELRALAEKLAAEAVLAYKTERGRLKTVRL